jgi:hypothetical protein
MDHVRVTHARRLLSAFVGLCRPLSDGAGDLRLIIWPSDGPSRRSWRMGDTHRILTRHLCGRRLLLLQNPFFQQLPCRVFQHGGLV